MKHLGKKRNQMIRRYKLKSRAIRTLQAALGLDTGGN